MLFIEEDLAQLENLKPSYRRAPFTEGHKNQESDECSSSVTPAKVHQPLEKKVPQSEPTLRSRGNHLFAFGEDPQKSKLERVSIFFQKNQKLLILSNNLTNPRTHET